MTPEQLDQIVAQKEKALIEFKEAKNSFDTRDRSDYCAGISNSGGGYLLLGVKDNGEIIGTDIYRNSLEKISNDLKQKIDIWVDVFEVNHKDGRVVVFQIPARPIGSRVKSDGHYHYPIRKGESLVEMDDITTRTILNESQPDFSSSICKGLSMDDLDEQAIKRVKELWSKKEVIEEYLRFSNSEVLEKLFLKTGNSYTFAALLLCAKPEKIAQYLPEAEIRFGWKNSSNTLDFNSMQDWRHPFLLIFDEIWDAINARNTRYPFAQGFIEGDIWTYDQKTIREAVLNAFAHRDYQERGSIFIEASPDFFIIKNPGKFLAGVSAENILDVQGKWRNRLLMETLGKIGLVERYGHGLDRIFRKTIADGKGKPIIEELSSDFIQLTIPTQVRDERFVTFLNSVANSKQITFDFVKDLLFLEEIRESNNSKDEERKKKFTSLGIIEKIGLGRGTKYILSKKLYGFIGKETEYTRNKWLEKPEQLQTLWKFFQQHKKGRMKDFRDGLFQGKLTNNQILRLLKTLKVENKIYFDGKQRSPSAYWKIKKVEL